MEIREMKKQLYEYYKKRGWNVMAINKMPDNRVVAIYYNYSKKGFPTPKQEYEQLCLF